jgi:hypothetical protein
MQLPFVTYMQYGAGSGEVDANETAITPQLEEPVVSGRDLTRETTADSEKEVGLAAEQAIEAAEQAVEAAEQAVEAAEEAVEGLSVEAVVAPTETPQGNHDHCPFISIYCRQIVFEGVIFLFDLSSNACFCTVTYFGGSGNRIGRHGKYSGVS